MDDSAVNLSKHMEVFMEKISNIIKSNARTRAVDVSQSQPVRPGAPAWGRPEGKVTKSEDLGEAIQDRISLSDSVLGKETAKDSGTYKPSVSAKQSRIAEDMANKFFTKRIQEIEADSAKGDTTGALAESDAP